MIEFEKVLIKEEPNFVLVVGDVNSTIACSITAKKLNIKVIHVEAGLRSYDMKMPEEINRVLTDRISDYLFITEKSGIINLKKEGMSNDNVHLVGNVMIDSLVHYQKRIDSSKIVEQLKLTANNYILVTLHRPSNVDNYKSLKNYINFLNSLASIRKVVFPIHPRTKKNLELYSLYDLLKKDILLTDPIGYIDFTNCAMIKND